MPVRQARREKTPEPAWDVAKLFPPQGQWSEEEYFALDTNRLVEFDNGRIEVLPLATTSHQLIAAFLHSLIFDYFSNRDLGLVLFAALPVRLWPGKIREPDILFMEKRNFRRINEQYWDGADLVVEIVSPGSENRKRDLREKRRDYAKGRVPEYWIVDPEEELITVLTLTNGKYAVHGKFGPGEEATSAKWPDLKANVSQVFRAGHLPR